MTVGEFLVNVGIQVNGRSDLAAMEAGMKALGLKADELAKSLSGVVAEWLKVLAAKNQAGGLALADRGQFAPPAANLRATDVASPPLSSAPPVPPVAVTRTQGVDGKPDEDFDAAAVGAGLHALNQKVVAFKSGIAGLLAPWSEFTRRLAQAAVVMDNSLRASVAPGDGVDDNKGAAPPVSMGGKFSGAASEQTGGQSGLVAMARQIGDVLRGLVVRLRELLSGIQAHASGLFAVLKNFAHPVHGFDGETATASGGAGMLGDMLRQFSNRNTRGFDTTSLVAGFRLPNATVSNVRGDTTNRITINVNGADEPHAVGSSVVDHLRDYMNALDQMPAVAN